MNLKFKNFNIKNMNNIIQRAKSSRRIGEISRFEAHNYEKTIQNLLEKIDTLESKLMLVCKDKYDAITEKNYFETDNKILLDKLESENDKNIKLSNINEEYSEKITALKNKNKNIKEMHNINIKNLNNEIDFHKDKIKKLNKEIDSKNDCIKNYSVDNKLIKQASNNFKNLFQNQLNINKNQTNQIVNLENVINDFSIKKQDEAILLLEIEMLKKDNIRLVNLLNGTDEYRDFCHLGITPPLGIKYIKPIEEKKEEIKKPLSKKEERERTLTEYKKYMENKKKKLEKEDRNWVPLEAYNYLVECKNKYKLDLNNDIIEKLLHILNDFWKNRLDREVIYYRTIYQNQIKELKRKLQAKDTTNDYLLMKTTSNYGGNMTNKFTKTGTSNLFGKKSTITGNTNTNINSNVNLNSNIDDDYYFKTALNARDKRLENEIANLKKKLEQKDNKDRQKRNKIYNQGNLLMTQKIITEIDKLKNKVNSLYKEYEEKVKFSVNNYENSSFKNKIMDDSVKIFFTSVMKEVEDVEKKIENWKFNIQRNIGGMDYSSKNN
jgi:hypothetical protein